MKTLFYSTKEFEKQYLNDANKLIDVINFTENTLTLSTVADAAGYDCISIFTSDIVTEEILVALKKIGIKYITTRATGYDNINIDKANELDITVANVASYSPNAIAEHAVALLLAANRKIATAYNQVKQQNFLMNNLIGFDLNNKIVGIIGVGKIGAVFAKIMHGFGCKILGHDIVENKKLTELYGVEYVDLNSLCKTANIISVHTGLTKSTKYIINKNGINQMQKGTMLINTGRGGCVNTTDVIEGLENGQIGFYAADVYEHEAGIFFTDLSNKDLKDVQLKKLISMPNVIITPHQGFTTHEALTDIATSTFYNINCWNTNKLSKNELNNQLNDEDIQGNGNN